MTKRIRLGMLTPSSNTVVETMTTAMLSELPNVSAHFSRFKVTEIAVADSSDRQFGEDEILRAADLLEPREGRCHRLERHVGELAGLRARRAGSAQRIVASTGMSPPARRSSPFERSSSAPASRASDWSRRMSTTCRRKSSTIGGGSGISCPAERHCGLQRQFRVRRGLRTRHRRDGASRRTSLASKRWRLSARTCARRTLSRAWRRNSACRSMTRSRRRCGRALSHERPARAHPRLGQPVRQSTSRFGAGRRAAGFEASD